MDELARRTGAVLFALAVSSACGSAPTAPSAPDTPSSPTASQPTPPASATTVSLILSGPTLFTNVGQTRAWTATARMSDGTDQVVTESASWESSRPEVATVSAGGVVTAVAPGLANISVSYGGKSAAVDIVIPLVGGRQRTVRLMYLIPQDREPRPHHRRAIQDAFTSLQTWFRDQLGGQVFSLYSLEPDECMLPHASDFYLVDTYSKIAADARRCAPVTVGASQSIAWVLYADVLHGCNAPGRLGVGSPGLALLGRGDIQGLAGEPADGDCGREPNFPIGRYIGGAGHELGHAFGLPHPPGCDAGQPTCDARALMWSGYSLYPNTYLRDDEKQVLRGSAFFNSVAPTWWDTEGRPR